MQDARQATHEGLEGPYGVGATGLAHGCFADWVLRSARLAAERLAVSLWRAFHYPTPH